MRILITTLAILGALAASSGHTQQQDDVFNQLQGGRAEQPSYGIQQQPLNNNRFDMFENSYQRQRRGAEPITSNPHWGNKTCTTRQVYGQLETVCQ